MESFWKNPKQIGPKFCRKIAITSKGSEDWRAPLHQNVDAVNDMDENVAQFIPIATLKDAL